jgi:hypothetical protein
MILEQVAFSLQVGPYLVISPYLKVTKTRSLPYGIAVDTAKVVDTAIALEFYFMSTAKMQ